jgi:A/G-specific adenine glycosylase
LPQNKAAEYNQAIMDFGAVICKPSPVCDSCFFNAACTAFLTSTQHLLPVKKNKIKTSERWLNYFILRHENDILIHQRTGNDIWQQLYEFFLIETMGPVPAKKNLNELVQQLGIKYNKADKPIKISQRLSHQLVNFSFTVLYLDEKQNIEDFSWVKFNDIDRYAFPKTLQQLIVRHLLKEEVK